MAEGYHLLKASRSSVKLKCSSDLIEAYLDTSYIRTVVGPLTWIINFLNFECKAPATYHFN